MKDLTKLGFKDNSTYIIAEIGINHGGDITVAKQLIDSAVRTGANAVKFQTYLTEKRVAANSPIFDILKKCELPFSAFEELKAYAEAKNVDFFSTPFDSESVEFLDSINCNIYKIASFDLPNHEFLAQVASKNKQVILSVGMSNLDEIRKAVDILKQGTNKIILLHCISAYPTNEKDSNLRAVHTLIEKFPECAIGQSDHTNDIDVPSFAVAAGAQVLEKHFKIDEDMDCIDAPVSITEKQMTQLVNNARRIEKILGHGVPKLTDSQKDIEQYRRHSELDK